MKLPPDQGAGQKLRPANLHLVRGSRRLVGLALAVVCLGVLAGVPAALGGLDDEKKHVDAQIDDLRSEIDQAKAEEGVLTEEIRAHTTRIRSLESDIALLDGKVAKLEADLVAKRARLAELRDLYRYQTQRLELLTGQHAEAQRRLDRRLVDLYETDQPDALAILLESGSLNDLIEQLQLLNEIGKQDTRIVAEIAAVKAELRVARRRTAGTKAEAARVTAALAERMAEQRAARDELVSRERALVGARAGKESLLASVRDERHADEENLEEMLAASAAIAAKIQAAQAAAAAAQGAPTVGSGAAPAGGFVWPVQGVLTSGFGPRWGRMHEGIDIGASAGTPIVAAAAGTIIFAGWFGGYGNLTVIDHGNGVATAYGHQSAFYVTSGPVSQGQAIGAVGSTGNSTGDHLHFEVRINGAPVDPLGYL